MAQAPPPDTASVEDDTSPLSMEIILRSGARIPLRVVDLKMTRVGGQLTGLEWEYTDDAPLALRYVRLEEVAAIIRHVDSTASALELVP